ncbi:MAG: hypothetical protein LM576_07785 [Thermofilum sp.]|nr:hypothetical protein [Thermofilum sp.]
MELGREPDEPMKCKVCGAATLLYRCNYCGGLFCVKHHLPPNHDCPNLHLWKAKAPPGLTIRFEGRRYASVDVPVASEPRAPAAAEHAGYDSQLGTAKLHDRILEELERPYARKWRRVPVEGGEGGKPSKAAKLFPIFLVTFILSLAALFSVPEDYTPPFFLLTIVSLVGTTATLLSLLWRPAPP